MTNQEIVTKAVEKAIKNGFYSESRVEVVTHPLIPENIREIRLYSDTFTPNPFVFHPLEIIFSAPFAKAFWGEKYISVKVTSAIGKSQNPISDRHAHVRIEITNLQKAWRAHLQIMILEEDPIRYLEQFI